MKVYGGGRNVTPFILNLGTVRSELSASRPGDFIPAREEVPSFRIVPSACLECSVATWQMLVTASGVAVGVLICLVDVCLDSGNSEL
jgi:hypothetical protein